MLVSMRVVHLNLTFTNLAFCKGVSEESLFSVGNAVHAGVSHCIAGADFFSYLGAGICLWGNFIYNAVLIGRRCWDR